MPLLINLCLPLQNVTQSRDQSSTVFSRPSIDAQQPSIVGSQAPIVTNQTSELSDEDILQSENDDYVSWPGHTFPLSNVDSYYVTRGRALK